MARRWHDAPSPVPGGSGLETVTQTMRAVRLFSHPTWGDQLIQFSPEGVEGLGCTNGCTAVGPLTL
jgi:hypothetical protein